MGDRHNDVPGADQTFEARLAGGETSFSGLDLSEVDWSAVAVSGCTFTDCRFGYSTQSSSVEEVRFEDCRFVRCDFRRCRISGAFRRCTFNECDLYRSAVVGSTTWSGSIFTACSLNLFDFTSSDLSLENLPLRGAPSCLVQLDEGRFIALIRRTGDVTEHEVDRRRDLRLNEAVSVLRQVETQFAANGLRADEAGVYYLRKCTELKDALQHRRLARSLTLAASWATTGFGERLYRVFGTLLALMIVTALALWSTGSLASAQPPPPGAAAALAVAFAQLAGRSVNGVHTTGMLGDALLTFEFGLATVIYGVVGFIVANRMRNR